MFLVAVLASVLTVPLPLLNSDDGDDSLCMEFDELHPDSLSGCLLSTDGCEETGKSFR